MAAGTGYGARVAGAYGPSRMTARSRFRVVVTGQVFPSVGTEAALLAAIGAELLVADPDAARLVAGGGWGLTGLRSIPRLSGLRTGLVGYGRIARHLAACLSALGCQVVAHDPFVAPGPVIPPLLPLADLLAGCDVVSLHAPLTPATRGLIGAAELAPTQVIKVLTGGQPDYPVRA